MQYHYRVAVGHYARMLGCGSGRGNHAPVAVLLLLWSYAADPFADSAFVRVGVDEFNGYVTTPGRLRQIVAELRKIGAVERGDFGYRLCKPSVDELDSVARAQLQTATTVVAPKDVPRDAERLAYAVERRQRAEAKRETRERRKTTLDRLGKKPSDVRDMLARLADVPKNTLRFSGAGSGAVTAAIDWLVDTGATWREFYRLFAALHTDRSEDRPADLRWVFASKHAAYLERMVAVSHTLPRTENDAHA